MVMGSGHIICVICYIIFWELHGEIYFCIALQLLWFTQVLVKTRESSKFVQQEYLIRNSHLKLGMYLVD